MSEGPRLVRRTRSIARKQGVRRRRLLLGAGSLFSVLIVLAAGWLFLVPAVPWLKVDQTTITGLGRETKETAEIESVIRRTVTGMSTLRSDEAGLREALAPFPRVADARISMDFPNSATVEVDLRRDGSVVRASPDDLVIATDGRVLGKFRAGESDSLPKLDAGPVSQSPGERLDGEALDQALVAGAAPAELRPYIESVKTGDSGMEVELTDGSTLLFGNPSRARLKWAAAATVIADPDLVGRIDTIDLAVPRRPGVVFADGTEVESELTELPSELPGPPSELP
jgi:cell division septal protein FtsQ